MIIDTHMHIYDSSYDDIREEVIQNALDNDVKIMIAIGCDYSTSLKALELANKYPFIYCAIGLHPYEVLKEKDKDLKWIYELAKNKKVVAIGEIGLDYYWDKSYINEQKEMFVKQIDIARKLNLPIIVHSRDAISDTYNIIESNSDVKGVIHCFPGSLEMANRFIKLGYYLGIGGVLTFKNSKDIKNVVKNIDLKYLLSETDSPYLTPHPYRGKLNKPEYIKYVCYEIATIKEKGLDYVTDILSNNAIELFKLGGRE